MTISAEYAQKIPSIDPAGRTMLQVRGITYAFDGEVPLIEGLDFDIREGEFVTFLAPSGIGKTTLFRIVAGLLEPQLGEVILQTKAAAAGVGSVPPPGSSGRLGRVGYMPQRDCLMPWRPVIDNAALGLELAGVPRREARKRVLDLLPSFGLSGTEGKYPDELSGGMRQRVSFLRTVLTGRDMLLLDEPFSALDAMTRVSMQEWLLGVWEQHRKTVLFITHDVDEALLLSDRVLIAAKSPITRLSEIQVDIPRPRTYEATMGSEFISLKRRVRKLLAADASEGGEGR